MTVEPSYRIVEVDDDTNPEAFIVIDKVVGEDLP